MSGAHDNDRYKIYTEKSYYHVYNRGINKQIIFHDDDDYRQFLGILKRQLAAKKVFDKGNRHFYSNFQDEIEILAFALMPNHFHLLIYQEPPDGMTRFMKSLLTGYSKYYNKKYDRVGPLFQGRYKAEKICGDETVAIVSRYIHRNPKDWLRSPHTSIDFYSGNRRAEWLKPQRVLRQFSSFENYILFLQSFNATDFAPFQKFE